MNPGGVQYDGTGGNGNRFSERQDSPPGPFKVEDVLERLYSDSLVEKIDDMKEPSAPHEAITPKVRQSSTPLHLGAIAQWSEEKRADFAFHLLLTCHLSTVSSIVDRIAPFIKHDFVDDLPKEIVLRIFSYLDPPSLVKCMRVSRKWNQLANEPLLWRQLFEDHGWRINADYLEIAGSLQAPTPVRQPQTNFSSSSYSSKPSAKAGGVRRAFSTVYSKPKSLKQLTRPNSFSYSNLSGLSHYTPPLKSYSWKDIYKNRLKLDSNWRQGNYFVSQLHGHSQTVYCVQCEGNIMVTGSKDCTVKIWSLAARTPNLTLNGHSASVLCVQYRQVPTLNFPLVVSGSSDATILAWNARTGRPILRFSGHSESVLGMQLDDRVLVTCSKDRSIRVWRSPNGWDMDQDYLHDDTGDEAFYFEQPMDNSISSLASSNSFNPHSRSQSEFSYHSSNLTPQPLAGRSYVTNSDDGQFSRISIGLGQPLKVLVGHRAAVNAVQFAQGKIVSASGDRTVKIWDLHSGSLIRTLIGHETGIACVHYDGHRIFSGSSDTTIKVWDPLSGKCASTITGHTALVRALQYDASSYRLVSGSYDETIRVWDVRMLSPHGITGASGEVTSQPVLILRVGDGVHSAVAARQDAVWRGRQARAAVNTSGFFDINSLINQQVRLRHQPASYSEYSGFSNTLDASSAEFFPVQSEQITSNFQTEDGVPVTSTSTRLTFNTFHASNSSSATNSSAAELLPVREFSGLQSGTAHSPSIPPSPPPLPPRMNSTVQPVDIPQHNSATSLDDPTFATSTVPLPPFQRHDPLPLPPLPLPPTPQQHTSSSNRVLKICLDGGKIISCSQSPHILLWDFTRSVQNSNLFYSPS